MAKDKIKEQELPEFIYLADEEGNEVGYEFLDVVEYDGEQYAILLPEAGDDPDVEIVKMIELIEEDEEVGYVGLNDEEVLNAVFEIFLSHVEEEMNSEEE